MESLGVLIDRMVDGPLPPAELREAVARLDGVSVHEGWRRCGLAFLETQCWEQAMRDGSFASARRTAFVEERALRPPPPTAGESWGEGAIAAAMEDNSDAERAFRLPPSPAERKWSARAITASWQSAAAAVILLAIGGGLGWLAASATSTQAPQSPPIATNAEPPPPLIPGQVPGLPADRIPTVREVARLRIGDGPNHAEVPILDGPGLDARRLMEQPPVVSDYQEAALRAEGYELSQDRRLLPVRLGDGRTAAVPVDRVRVRYVGNDPL